MCQFIHKELSSTKPGETPQSRLYQLKRNLLWWWGLCVCVTASQDAQTWTWVHSECVCEDVPGWGDTGTGGPRGAGGPPWRGWASSNRSEAQGGQKTWASYKQNGTHLARWLSHWDISFLPILSWKEASAPSESWGRWPPDWNSHPWGPWVPSWLTTYLTASQPL